VDIRVVAGMEEIEIGKRTQEDSRDRRRDCIPGRGPCPLQGDYPNACMH
jgi:hypothetical protein